MLFAIVGDDQYPFEDTPEGWQSAFEYVQKYPSISLVGLSLDSNPELAMYALHRRSMLVIENYEQFARRFSYQKKFDPKRVSFGYTSDIPEYRREIHLTLPQPIAPVSTLEPYLFNEKLVHCR